MVESIQEVMGPQLENNKRIRHSLNEAVPTLDAILLCHIHFYKKVYYSVVTP